MNCDITEECDQNDTNNGKDRKLHNQKLMLQCFNDLQKSLHDKNPDRAIKNVERFKSLILPELTTLMLLKYPEVVEVFHSIQCHAGKSNTLELICEEVRERVEHIYVRIQAMFSFYPRPFMATFREEADKFKLHYINLSDEFIFQATTFFELKLEQAAYALEYTFVRRRHR